MEASPQPHPHAANAWATAPSDLHDAIRRRAEEIYIRNGRAPGRDQENWSQAEAEILRGFSAATRRTAIVVNLNGVQYVGEYTSDASEGYLPGEFHPGAPIPVRFDGDQMFVIRRNGKELKTTIVQQG